MTSAPMVTMAAANKVPPDLPSMRCLSLLLVLDLEGSIYVVWILSDLGGRIARFGHDVGLVMRSRHGIKYGSKRVDVCLQRIFLYLIGFGLRWTRLDSASAL